MIAFLEHGFAIIGALFLLACAWAWMKLRKRRMSEADLQQIRARYGMRYPTWTDADDSINEDERHVH